MLELFIVVFDYVWFVPWLPLQIHGCPVLGNPATVVFLLFRNLPWSFMPPGPLYLLLLIPENMPLKITFFHSFYHLLCAEFLTTCPKLRCTWTSQCCEKANVVPCPCLHGTCSPLGKTDTNQMLTSPMPNGNCELGCGS